MTGTQPATLQQRTAFARNCGTRSMPSPRTQVPGLGRDAVLGAMSSRDSPSAWCTCSGVTKSKSLLWLTQSDGLATGARDSDRPSNFRIQRAALRAAADPVR